MQLASYPYSTADSEQDPEQPKVPHMMIGRPATRTMRCTASCCEHSSSQKPSGSSKFDRSGALGPPLSAKEAILGLLPPCHNHAISSKHDDFRHSARQLEKGSSHNIDECVRDQVQAQEKQAEGDVPGDCVCTGCPDNPTKCNARVLSRRVLLEVLLCATEWSRT